MVGCTVDEYWLCGWNVLVGTIRIAGLMCTLDCPSKMSMLQPCTSWCSPSPAAMVSFCNPGVLGSPAQFRRHFEAPILAGREPGELSGGLICIAIKVTCRLIQS